MDAVITECALNADGTATIRLSIDGKNMHTKFTVLNPPAKFFDACVGSHVHGYRGALMIGDSRWAEAAGYGKLRLVDRRRSGRL